MTAGMLRLFTVTATRRWRPLPVVAYATTPIGLQRKLTMSKRRLRPKPKPTLGPSIPICILLVLITAYMTYITRQSSNDDSMFR
ncbi:hypothetical protein DQ04_16201000 [Trypanosoma grayi]|uniref:hypothetical protein n=1 Tax=Trypanosoma grayi TaxID=71804 RepID=UPI0004F4539D|nr:hypothetical protein DQ04_16201000 [Trypanosoma grayi]KEG06058.1 hypothetical protein DQ04_16201000 [Trypanosoma grayi]